MGKGRRSQLNDQARYRYQVDHFIERIQQRYDNLRFGEADFLALHDLIHRQSPDCYHLASNKDGTVIYRVRYKNRDIICNYNPLVALPVTEDTSLQGMITTVLDPRKVAQIRPR